MCYSIVSTFREAPELGNNDVWLGASDLETRGVFRWGAGKAIVLVQLQK